MKKPFPESPRPVVAANDRFSHVMALALDPTDNFQSGIIRCILSRDGDVAAKGQIDRSELRHISRRADQSFEIGEVCRIHRQEEILQRIEDRDFEFIGLEDPDIVFDQETGILHVYFSISFVRKGSMDTRTYLGHAFGPSLNALEMTMPVLGFGGSTYACAKELSMVPPSKSGVRFTLVESSFIDAEGRYNSTVRVAECVDLGSPWSFGETLIIPCEQKDAWIAGHVSPGPLLPRDFVDVGDGKLVGFLNGREAEYEVDGRTLHGMFAIGLFLYDYENAKVEWVSPEPLIVDSLARTITFASQFVVDRPGEGTLYAHVDDSFVRAYAVQASDVLALLPLDVVMSRALAV